MRLTVCRCDAPEPIFSGLVKKSKAQHIDRERKAIKSARFKLRRAVRSFLASASGPIISHISAELAKLRKEEEGDDDLGRIMRSVPLDWSDLQGDVQPHIESILSDGGAEALAQVEARTETNVALVNERAVAYSKQRAAELVTKISESTRNMLRSDVAQAMQEGWSNDRLADELEDNYAFSSGRADMIARTETAYADVQGNLDAYKISGVVASKQWITGAGCCEDCDALDGVTVDLDESFDSADGPIDGPPAHPNCRCDCLPITKDDADDE